MDAQQIIKQYRRYEKNSCREISTLNMTINIRSYFEDSWNRDDINAILKRKSLHREYGIKNMLKERFYSKMWSMPDHKTRIKTGHKTYLEGGKYYSYDPAVELLPF